MKKEDFFEVLGELDDDIVKGVKSTMKKNVNWKAWGAMAACLAIVVVLGLCMTQSEATPPNKEADISSVGAPVRNVKPVINFEGRVTEVEENHVTLDTGKIVRIAEDTAVTTPDGNSGTIHEGDYIQGYAENAESNEMDARYILITTL